MPITPPSSAPAAGPAPSGNIVGAAIATLGAFNLASGNRRALKSYRRDSRNNLSAYKMALEKASSLYNPEPFRFSGRPTDELKNQLSLSSSSLHRYLGAAGLQNSSTGSGIAQEQYRQLYSASLNEQYQRERSQYEINNQNSLRRAEIGINQANSLYGANKSSIDATADFKLRNNREEFDSIVSVARLLGG